jgi:hypothetical protein
MSVYKPQGSPYYHFDFVWKGRRFFGSTGCKSKRDAVAYENRERQKAVLPSQEREPITVDEACGLAAEHLETRPSWATARYMLDSLVKGLGGAKLLSEVSQRDLQVFFARRRDGRSNATVNREIENCRSVWLRAQKARYDVGEMPDWMALMLIVPASPPRELSIAEEPELFAELRADWRGRAISCSSPGGGGVRCWACGGRTAICPRCKRRRGSRAATSFAGRSPLR